MHLLLIEDEFKMADFIRKGLEENGFRVDVAHHGNDGLEQAKSLHYDLIILDIMLPGMDGLEIIKNLREKKNLTPVIFLTARDSLDDRLQGLSLGGDDYIVKPFAFSELLARIQVVLRRGKAVSNDTILREGDLEINLALHKVYRGNETIELTPKEFALLNLLMRFKGDVVSRTRIAEHIWNLDSFHETNVVDVHMRRLRAKMDDPYINKLIHTVRGVGYMLEARG